MSEGNCGEHRDPLCRKCARYVVTWETERGTQTWAFWVGQDSGADWEPYMGDSVSIRYVAPDPLTGEAHPDREDGAAHE